ncbi:hypothetical protein ACP4OV_023183 [Aristida adscensionis]
MAGAGDLPVAETPPLKSDVLPAPVGEEEPSAMALPPAPGASTSTDEPVVAAVDDDDAAFDAFMENLGIVDAYLSSDMMIVPPPPGPWCLKKEYFLLYFGHAVIEKTLHLMQVWRK